MNGRTSSHRYGDNVLISIVLPLYNEAGVLGRLHDAVAGALEQCQVRYEIIFVNDGSHDDSAAVLDDLAGSDKRVRVLHLSRNFGHQAAVQAGLLHTRGDAVIVMDSDLQDDPSCFPQFLEKWRGGYDVVYAIRCQRKEGWLKRLLFFSFYRLLNAVSSTPMPMDAGNFGLIDGRVARQIAAMPECDRYFAGLRSWVGFRQTGVLVERQTRHDDQPRLSTFGLFQLAKTAIFSFSRVPLSMFYAIAAVSVFVCLVCVGFTLFHKLFTHRAIPGWTSITIVASFFGAINSLGIGILGEYMVRIYDQVRSRPKFIVGRSVNFDDSTGDHRLEAEILRSAQTLSSEAKNERFAPSLGTASPVESTIGNLTRAERGA